MMEQSREIEPVDIGPLHPLTHASIALGEMAEGPLVDVWSCGCQRVHVGVKRWVLCQYHTGFNDGAEAS